MNLNIKIGNINYSKNSEIFKIELNRNYSKPRMKIQRNLKFRIFLILKISLLKLKIHFRILNIKSFILFKISILEEFIHVSEVILSIIFFNNLIDNCWFSNHASLNLFLITPIFFSSGFNWGEYGVIVTHLFLYPSWILLILFKHETRHFLILLLYH